MESEITFAWLLLGYVFNYNGLENIDYYKLFNLSVMGLLLHLIGLVLNLFDFSEKFIN